MFYINDKEGTRGPTQIFEPGPPGIGLPCYATERFPNEIGVSVRSIWFTETIFN